MFIPFNYIWSPIFFFFNPDYDNPFFFLKKKHKMSHHSSTITCRSANIWYTFYNMYLIIRVTSTQRITHNNIINIAEGTYL